MHGILSRLDQPAKAVPTTSFSSLFSQVIRALGRKLFGVKSRLGSMDLEFANVKISCCVRRLCALRNVLGHAPVCLQRGIKTSLCRSEGVEVLASTFLFYYFSMVQYFKERILDYCLKPFRLFVLRSPPSPLEESLMGGTTCPCYGCKGLACGMDVFHVPQFYNLPARRTNVSELQR